MNTFALLVFAVFAGIIGLVAGGLINMLADDLPYTFRIRLPHYPDGAPRPHSAWLGLTAFLLGKRESPNAPPQPVITESALEPDADQPPDGLADEPTDRATEDAASVDQTDADIPDTAEVETEEHIVIPDRVSWRHPIVELVTAGLFVYIALSIGLSGRALFLMGCVAILLLITVIDLEHRMILYAVMFPAYVYAIVGVALVNPEISEKVPFRDYLIGGAAGFGLFTVLYLGGMAFNAIMANARGEDLEEVAFGYGDVMLATLSGFMLGWQALIFAVTIAVFAGGAGALVYLAFRFFVRGRYEMFTALPYGQYIVFGTVVMLLWRAPVISFLQRYG